ncbi:glycosyltransferase [Candidatus Woesearchaeota archaeon]|nr:glycosyltransferase [Candidatus Woesearchaeota archaeon]
MISVIICSRNLELLKGLSENIQETIGCSFELVAIDNRKNQYGICSAYNSGIKKAKSDILCFVHEDVRFLTKNWGEILLKKLQDKKVGVIGVAGTTLLPEDGIWYNSQRPFVQGQVVHSFNGKEQVERYGTLGKDSEVVVLDGLFLSCRKETAEKFRFNEALFQGFHFYDIDFCVRVSQNFNNLVTYDILLKHFSGGNIDKEFQDSRKKFIELYKHLLPYTKLKLISQKRFPWQTLNYDSNKKYPKILVGCPTSDSHAYCLDEYIGALFSLDYPFYDILIVDNSEDGEYKKKIEEYGVWVIKSSHEPSVLKRIVDSRNALRQYVLEKDYDYFLSLEQDVVPPSDVIKRLLEGKQKVSSGLYFGFTNKYEFPNIKSGTVVMPVVYKLFENNEKTKEAGLQALRRFGINEINPPRKVAVRMVGLGCMLIHRDVLEKITFRYEEGKMNTDDRYFSDDVFKLHIPIVLDTSVRCKHLLSGKSWDWATLF